MRTLVLIAAAVLAAAPGAHGLAQTAPQAPPMTMPMSAVPPGKPLAGPVQESMMAAMDRMSTAMAAAPVTGDADRDFVAMMIPHHQGAVDMAHFELEHGKDPAMRRLARAVVAAQEKELDLMRHWQARHPATR